MKEFELCIEEINPCGGDKHSTKTIIEIEAESPEAYIKENGRFPVIDTTYYENGDVFITTGDGKGYFVKYTFSE